VALALALSAPAIFAQARKDPPKPREPSLGKKRASQTPEASLAGSIKAKGQSDEAKGPSLTFEQFRFSIEAEVSTKRSEEIRDLQKLIGLGGSENEMPGWLFRLAELYWEESQYYFFEANRKDDEVIRLGKNADPGQVDRLKAEKKNLEGKSKGYQAEAVARYQDIVKKFPRYQRLDEVLFFLGENLTKQQRVKESLGIYKLLITRFPKSKYVPDAWMAFGEFYFNSADKGNRNDNLAKALEAYKKAASFTESSVYGFALYKQAWVYYNLGQWSEALDLFKAVIFFGDLPTSTIAKDKKLALVREARKDYVRTYSHVGSPSAAKEDFRKVGGEANWPDMLKGLAQLYYDEGKDKESILVYRMLIADKPLSPDAPLFQSRIVTCAGRIGNKRYTVEQARLFVKILHDIEKAKVVKDEKGQKALEEARTDAENTLRTLAVQYHNEYKKTRDDQTAAMASEVYQDYLAVFPVTHHAYEMRFFFAELLYALEKYERAGDEYTRVAMMDITRIDPRGAEVEQSKSKAVKGKPSRSPSGSPGGGGDAPSWGGGADEPPPQQGEEGDAPPPAEGQEEGAPAAAPAKKGAKSKTGKYFRDALEAAVFAYDEVAKKFEETEKKGASDPNTKMPIPKPKQQLMTACERYIKYVPSGPKYVEVAYKAANIYYRYNYFDESTRIFVAIAEKHPKHELSGYAANLVVDTYNILGDPKSVNEWARKFYANDALMKAHPQLKEDLAKVIEESAFKLVEKYEKERNFKKAAQAYLVFAKEWPRSKLAPTALFNASVDYFQAHSLDRAVAVREQLVRQYPNHSLAPKCIFANGGDYEAIADFDKAADFYERYYQEWARSTGRGGKAGKSRSKKKKPSQVESAAPAVYEEQKAQDALYNAGIFREGLHQPKQAEKDRLAYIDTWPNSKETPKVFLSLADLYEKEKQYGKAVKQLEEYQKKYGRDPNEWLQIQYRIVKIHEKTKNRGKEKKAYEEALAYYKQRRSRVKEDGLPVVAQAMYLELEPDFNEYSRINLKVPSKRLPATLKEKGRKLIEVDRKYRKVFDMKQAESAVCALYKIGLAYKNFAEVLYNAPIPKDIPKELRNNQQFIDNYKATLAEQAAPVEQKAVDGLELAMQSARQFAVMNDCSKKASEILLKYKPDKYGPPQEAYGEVKAEKMATDVREGNGLLAAVQPIPVKSATPDEPDEEMDLAPVSERPAAGEGGEGPPPEEAPPDGEPAPPRDPEPAPVKEPGQGEEDLLP
jgi:tetratricopeptide (TPR) repeat protein